MCKIINKIRNKNGFTLIELIVVLAVLGIISAITVPRFLGIQQQTKVDADKISVTSIAKVAELYYAKTNDTEITIKDLVDGGYLNADELKLQSTNQMIGDGETGTVKANITVNSTKGAVSVTVGNISY